VARQAVRESLVLLKNDGATLPLKRTAKRSHGSGAGADDVGRQCGGWTITWQGRPGPITGGTTILGAIRQALPVGAEVTYSKDGEGAAGADVAVVVVGEEPYAEMRGDSAEPVLSAADRAVIEKVKASGVPTAVVLLSGRPLVLGDALAKSDAFVAAWLPGSEGGGVADVLFGDWKPSGKLSYSWPRSVDQLPINVGDAKYDPLFAFGYGLSY
jgi:beta-glucosidase